MSKKNPTPEITMPREKLHMSMKDFSFFAKDAVAVVEEIRTILDSGHSMTLYMTQSTSLSRDLWMINQSFSSLYDRDIRFTRDTYDKAQVVVVLQKAPLPDEDEERLQELIKKAQKRYLGDADWDQVLEYLHDDDREEYEKLYGELR